MDTQYQIDSICQSHIYDVTGYNPPANWVSFFHDVVDAVYQQLLFDNVSCTKKEVAKIVSRYKLKWIKNKKTLWSGLSSKAQTPYNIYTAKGLNGHYSCYIGAGVVEMTCFDGRVISSYTFDTLEEAKDGCQWMEIKSQIRH